MSEQAERARPKRRPTRHDLRQPLTAILSASTALRSDPGLDEASRAALLRVVIDNAERLRRMLEELDFPADEEMP